MKILTFLLSFCAIFTLFGCGEKELPSAKITRDDARTGGSLSFVYDKKERTVTIGGRGEVVQYSSADETSGVEEGTRVGLKITAPDEKVDLSTATLEMNGVHYSSSNFLETINGQKQRFFEIEPLVSENDEKIELKICWAEGTKEQVYQIVIAPGTKFLDKNGEISGEVK